MYTRAALNAAAVGAIRDAFEDDEVRSCLLLYYDEATLTPYSQDRRQGWPF